MAPFLLMTLVEDVAMKVGVVNADPAIPILPGLVTAEVNDVTSAVGKGPLLLLSWKRDITTEGKGVEAEATEEGGRGEEEDADAVKDGDGESSPLLRSLDSISSDSENLALVFLLLSRM